LVSIYKPCKGDFIFPALHLAEHRNKTPGGIMKKKTVYTEICYLAGILIMALGTAFMAKADLGLSMVVAPAYLVYRKLSLVLPFFTFGMAEYTLQALLLIGLVLVLRRFKVSYLFSFVTAVLYGFALDGWTLVLSGLPAESMALRLVYYVVGLPLCALSVALFFHTYIAPEVYELIVMEVSKRWNLDSSKCKTVYDCTSCAVSIVLSFLFFGLFHFVGVNVGTVVCALVNGRLIGWISKWMESHWAFADKLPGFRVFFEK
jgi:uncharacterized membrane protein YczE